MRPSGCQRAGNQGFAVCVIDSVYDLGPDCRDFLKAAIGNDHRVVVTGDMNPSDVVVAPHVAQTSAVAGAGTF